VGLASLAGERMFFGEDSSSGVSGDLQSATTVASLMEGYFGMGQTISSLPAVQTLQVGTPGGRGQSHREDAAEQARRALADRIEDNLSRLLDKVNEVLRDNEVHVLALAHALETYKTLSGEDVAAVMEGLRGVVVDGTPYADPVFIEQVRYYHQAAAHAHREHSKPSISLPVPPPRVTASVVADGYGLTAYDTPGGPYGNGGNGRRNGSFGGSLGPADETSPDIPRQECAEEDDDSYEPPSYDPPDGSSPNGHPNGQD